VLVVGLLAGSYPALVMAALRPMQVMKGVANGPLSRLRVQRVLIVGQYAVSIALIAVSLVIYGQLRYMQDKNLGYDRDHLVTVQVEDEVLHEHYSVIREEWLRDPRTVAVTATTHLPTNITSATMIGPWEGSDEDDVLFVYQVTADYDFLGVFGIELLAGRTFSREVAGDYHAYLINETAARAMGWTPAEAVGRQLTRSNVDRTIIGVVKDFHMHSMHMPIEPLVIGLGSRWMGYLVARVRPEDLPATLASMEAAVTRFTSYPFEYRFLNDLFDQLYRTERRLGKTFGFLTILALLIASLGLFGLAAYAAEQRRKEIAVRKVLGGAAVDLVGLLSRDFLKLVAVAFILAAPVAYVGVSRWLESFAYRIEPGVSVFAAAGALAALAAFMAVGYHAFRAATADPVEALGSE
jgi:putative ABC transport system permease protein